MQSYTEYQRVATGSERVQASSLRCLFSSACSSPNRASNWRRCRKNIQFFSWSPSAEHTSLVLQDRRCCKFFSPWKYCHSTDGAPRRCSRQYLLTIGVPLKARTRSSFGDQIACALARVALAAGAPSPYAPPAVV